MSACGCVCVYVLALVREGACVVWFVCVYMCVGGACDTERERVS